MGFKSSANNSKSHVDIYAGKSLTNTRHIVSAYTEPWIMPEFTGLGCKIA